MSDDKIKKLLKEDSFLPEKPLNEWSNILGRIEQSKTSRIQIKFLAPSFLVITLFVFGGIQGVNYLQEKEEREIAEYILDSAEYWNQEDADYISEY